MSAMQFNKSPISLREGKAYIDGVEVMDCVSMSITATPDTWEGRQLKEKSTSTRWLGISFKGTMTERRSNPWLKQKVMEYMKSGKTPEMTVQGIMNDANSDYYADYGSDTVTALGCVLTGDIPLTALDSGGTVAEDSFNFNIKDIK